MNEFTLDNFLKHKEFIEMREAIEYAQHMDHEVEMERISRQSKSKNK